MKQRGTVAEIACGLMIDHLCLPALLVGVDGRIVEANTRAKDALRHGESTPILVNRPIDVLIAPYDQARFAEFRTQNPLPNAADGPDCVLDLDRAYGLTAIALSRMYGACGKVNGYFGQLLHGSEPAQPGETQIAKRAKLEPGPMDEIDLNVLKRRETRWKVALQSANQGVWDIDLVRGTHFYSATWRMIRGIGKDEAVPLTFDAFIETIHPDDADTVLTQNRRLLRGETDLVNYQYRQRHTDGRWIWLLSRGRVVTRDAEGKPARVIGTDTIITDIKHVETQHRRATQTLRLAMAAAEMGRWEYDVQNEIAYWDDRLLALFGLLGGDAIRHKDDWFTVMHPDDRDRMRQSTNAKVASREDFCFDYRVLKPSGEVVHVRTKAQFVNDPDLGERYVGVNIDITQDMQRAHQLEEARAQLHYESRHDALTGLSNRRGIDDARAEFMLHGVHQRQALLHLDLDNFKQINDTMGHAAGDAVLRHAAEVMRAATAPDWVAGRFGGDEFVVLIPDAPSDAELRELAQSIICNMSKPFLYEAQICNFAASIGIAVSDVGQIADAELFGNADLALYAAKEAGGRCATFFQEDMRRAATNRKNAFDALLNAVSQGELLCYYQPQFDTKTLRITGLEALVRWDHPSCGVLTPEHFLSVAEDMKIITQIDEEVLRKSREDLRRWQALGLDVPRIAVNLSADRLLDPSLITQLKALDLAPNSYSFELLESVFLDDYSAALRGNLEGFREMGIAVEIDDFGSGHASILSLLKIGPDRLKIDLELIRPITTSARQRKLVQAIIDIGHLQGVAVVAEGVETMDHARILRKMGCDVFQGFALAGPKSPRETAELLGQLAETDGCLTLADGKWAGPGSFSPTAA